MLISALLLGGALLAIVRLLPWATERRGPDRAIGGTVLAGARLVMASPFLRLIAGLLLLYVTVNTILYYQQAAVVAAAFTDSAARAAYFARVDFAVNALTVITQVIVTRVLLTRFGVTPLLMLSPLLVATGFAWLAASPTPLLLASIQVVHRAGNFSLIAPARESLFTRVDRESRYKAKAFIDTAIYRGGDLVNGWIMAGIVAMHDAARRGRARGPRRGMRLGPARVAGRTHARRAPGRGRHGGGAARSQRQRLDIGADSRLLEDDP